MYSRIAQHHMLRRGIFRPQGLNKAKRQEPCLGGKGIGYWSASPWQKQVQEERGKEEKVRGTIRQSFIVVQYQKGYSWGGGDSTELRGTWANYHLLVLRTNKIFFLTDARMIIYPVIKCTNTKMCQKCETRWEIHPAQLCSMSFAPVPLSSCCSQVDKIKNYRVIPQDHLHQISSTESPKRILNHPSPRRGGGHSGGAVCSSVCLWEHAQFHYVHTWGLCVCSKIYCDGVKDLKVTGTGEWCWNVFGFGGAVKQ